MKNLYVKFNQNSEIKTLAEMFFDMGYTKNRGGVGGA